MSAGDVEWRHVNLSDICVVDWGNTDLTKSAFVEGGRYLGVSAAGCDGRIDHAEHKAGIPVLSAIGARCGMMFFPEEDFTAIKNTITLTPRSGVVDGRFLYYLLTYIELPKRGAAQPFISKGDIQSFKVGIPPLPEQKRIVAILDEAFEGIATATANAEGNLVNAREVLPTLLDRLLSNTEGGRVVDLEQLVDDDCSLSYGIVQPGDEVESGLPIVRPTDLGAREVGLDGLKRINASLAAGYQRTTLRGRDILLCVRGTTGVVSQASSELAGANVTRGIVPIRFRKDVLIQDLGYFLLHSQGVQQQIRAATYGAALMQINIRDVRKIRVSVPPLHRQSDLLGQLEGIASDADRLDANYVRQLGLLSELKSSILHKAFSGQLTGNEAIAA